MQVRAIEEGGYLRTRAGTVCRVGRRAAAPYVRVTWAREGVRMDGFIDAAEEVSPATRDEWLASFGMFRRAEPDGVPTP